MTRNNTLIISILAALAVGNIAFGMMVQLIPLAMNAEGDSKFLIGDNVMVGQAGVLLTGAVLAWVRQHVRSHLLVMSAIAAALVGYSLFPLTSAVYSWFVIRFVIGICGSTIYTTGESWLQATSDDKSRGRVMGTYLMCQTLSFALGPLFIPWAGVNGLPPWLFCIMPMVLCFALMSRVKVEEVATGQAPASIWQTMKAGRLIFFAIGSVTLFDSMMITFFGLYAKSHGFSDGTASQLLSFGLAACMMMFFPIGWLSDHWSHKGTLALSYVAAMLCCLAVVVTIENWWVWPITVIIRGTSFGGYLAAYAMLGEKFKGTAMVAAASINSLLWGATGIIGPPVAGWFFDHFGIWLLPWFMAACFVPVLLALAARPKAA